MGRRRTKDLQLPEGVRPIGARLFWQPTTKRERLERKARKLAASVPLGPIVRVRGRISLTREQRARWAEVSGYSEAQAAGTVGELLAVWKARYLELRPNGRPRAKSTVKQYRWRLPHLVAQFGEARYGKTEVDVAAGRGLNAGRIQAFISASGSLGRPYLAILSDAFTRAGVLENRTTYNPCDKVIAPAGNPRTREPLEWEIEVLGAMAPRRVVALILEAKAISGYRISELLTRHRRDMNAEGIRFQVKGGKWETLTWSPRLRAIVTEAAALPEATAFPASAIFPHSRRKAYSYSGWYAAWADTVTAANRVLGSGGIVDPDTLERHPALSIDDLNVHDVRSKVHDDAEAMGREGHEQIGDTERVADRHYARREKRRTPLA